jgi:hypothetical protein
MSVKAAIDAELRALLERRIDLAECLARLMEHYDGAGSERPGEWRRRENAEALVQLGELEQQGRGRSSAVILAKRRAKDPNDPTEIEVLAQHFRRLRRKTSSARLRP